MSLVDYGFMRTRVESAARMGGSIGVAVAKPVVRPLSGAALATLDAVLQSRLAGDVIERVAASPLGERALSGALEGPLVEAVARDLVRYRVADRLLSEELVEATTRRVLDGTELEQVVEAALESPTVERLIGRAIDSRLADQAVVRLLQSDDLWLLVDEVARSPAVTAAIARQSASFADQVAGGVRARSTGADAWLERRARRLLRRSVASPPAPEAP
jgi:hypothetical protein